MKYQIVKDKAKRILVKKQEIRRLKYRFVTRSARIPMPRRWHHCIRLSKFPRNGSKVRVKNRCIITGRSHSIYRRFKISRIALRELASMGLINGVMKSSW